MSGSHHYAPFDPRLILEPQNEIIDGLWVGMRPASYVGYDLVVSCEEHLARKPMEGYAGTTVHLPLRDEDDFPLDDEAIWRVANMVAAVTSRGDKALIHCTGGLNRSGVIAVRAIQAATGASARSALATLRFKRDEFMLCNRAFERFVLGEQLPTAETSVFAAGESEQT